MMKHTHTLTLYFLNDPCKIFFKVLMFRFLMLKSVTGPVTIADQAAEESMVSIIMENFPSHAM